MPFAPVIPALDLDAFPPSLALFSSVTRLVPAQAMPAINAYDTALDMVHLMLYDLEI